MLLVCWTMCGPSCCTCLSEGHRVTEDYWIYKNNTQIKVQKLLGWRSNGLLTVTSPECMSMGNKTEAGGKGVFLRDGVKIITALAFRSVISVAYCSVLLSTTTHRDVWDFMGDLLAKSFKVSLLCLFACLFSVMSKISERLVLNLLHLLCVPSLCLG